MGPRFALIGWALAALLIASAACAQDYPSRPIRFLVGFPPGGSPDLVSRLLAQKLSERLGQAVVVEQKVGGTGLIANDIVAKSAPDGYSMVMMIGGHPVTAAVMKKLPYDPVKDFGMVSMVTAYPLVISVAQNSPIKSLSEVFARARAEPGRLSFASAGLGTLHHLLGEWMNIEAGTSMLHVPFKGESAAFPEVLGGRVDVMIGTATFSFGQIRGGKLRALALSSPARYPLMPELATIAETLPGVEFSSWLGVAVAPGTPRPIVDRLNREIRAALDLPEVRQKLADLGAVPFHSTPEEMRERIEREIVRWKRVVELKKIEKQ